MKFVVISKMYSVITKSLIRSESINLTNLTNLEDLKKKIQSTLKFANFTIRLSVINSSLNST